MKFCSFFYIICVVACDAGIIDSATLGTVEVALSCSLCCMGKLDCTEGSTYTVWM